jgi:hypothetical protein
MISLVADAQGTVIGHVAVSPVSISDGASGWFGLGRTALYISVCLAFCHVCTMSFHQGL